MGNLYYSVIDVTDYGPFVTKVILALPREVKPGEAGPEHFSVFVRLRDKQGDTITLPKDFIHRDVFVPSEGYRPVTHVYLCSKEGERVECPSRFLALEMPWGPDWKGSAALAADFRSMNGHGAYTVCDYTITQTAPIGGGEDALKGLVFDVCAGVRNPKADRFLTGVSRDPQQPIRYGYFVPEKLDSRKALIVFLHGAGEGGQDLPVAWSGNKVTCFTEKETQDKFGGAFVLVPQCDTMWMDDGSGRYGDSGLSMYSRALTALIREFIADHAQVIDPGRVYLGGDSNGGFMTMRLLMDEPGLFAAAFPICEAMLDARITDKDIKTLSQIPIWFTHAKTDPVVVPEKYVLPTYRRLMEAGAKDCHFTFWDRILDLHHVFPQKDGGTYEYFGHFAWIPVFNDDCRLDFDGQPVLAEGKPLSLMEWLASRKK